MSPRTTAFARVRARTLLALFVIATAALCVGTGSASAAFTPTAFSATPTNLQAAGHGDLNISATLNGASAEQSGDDLRQLQIELPAGQLFNPRAVTATCTDAQYGNDTCPAASVIGTITVKYRIAGLLRSATGSVVQLPATADSPLNFGFIVRPSGIQKLWFRSSKVSGLTSVRSGPDGDYGLNITIPQIPYLVKDAIGFQYQITVYDIGITLNQKAPSGKYFVFNPTRCEGATAKAAFTSVRGQTFSQASAYAPTGCSNVKFDPYVLVQPASTTADAATGVNAEFKIDTADAAIQRSHMRDIAVALPKGTTLNLDVLNATGICSEAWIAIGQCPANSKVGTANIEVPFLSAPMVGGIYLNSTDSGVRFVVIANGPNGTQAIFRALSKPTSIDGGSTILTTFTGLPQAPYNRAQLNFTSALVNNPEKSCPEAWSTINALGYSGTSAGIASRTAQTGCIPKTTITTPVANPTRNNRPSVSFTSDIPGSTFKCQIDNTGWQDCTSPFTPATALSDGQHRIYARAFFAGVGDFSPPSTTFVVDTKAPTLNVTSPVANAEITGDTVKFEWTADEPVTVKCALGSLQGIEDCTSGKTYNNVPPDIYSALISARDAAGNVKAVIRTVTVTEPRVNPEITITSPQPGEQLKLDRVTLNYTAVSPVGVDLWRKSCQVQVKNGTRWDYVDGEYACDSPSEFRGLPANSDLRLVVTAEDDDGNEGTAIVEFRSGQRDPYALVIDDGPNGTTTNDRTPTFRLDPFADPLYPAVTHRCALIRPGATTRDWKPCEGTTYTSPDALADGDWVFVTQSVASADRMSNEYTQDFAVGPWNPSYSATVSTTAAGAHPDLDVNIDVPSGQLRKFDITLPKGLIGSLNSFDECPANVIANPRNCADSTKIGSVVTLIKFSGLALAPLPGSVYLTAPQVAGDAAGIVIIVPRPVSGFGDVVIPMRLQLINNAGNMRVFSDSIPTQVEWIGQGFYDFYVENFKMHLNGSQGSPFPLLTNATSCTSSQFSTVIGALDGEEAPAQSAPYTTTGCDQLAAAPQFTQTLGNLQASDDETDQFSDVVADLSLASGSAAPSSIVLREPSLIAPNFGSFGEQRDQCTGGSVFDSDPGPLEVLSFRYLENSCPPMSKIGTMTVNTPLLKTPLVGDIHWVARSPIPWFGVNLNNDRFNLNLVGTVIVEAGRIKVTFSNIPDVPMTSAKVSLNLPDRVGKNGATISGKLLTIGHYSDPACISGAMSDTAIKSQSGSLTQIAQPLAFLGCAPE